MGLDSFRSSNIEQVKKDYQTIEEIEPLSFDSNLKSDLKAMKAQLEMEKYRLSREEEYNRMLKDMNYSTHRSMDNISINDSNFNNFDSSPTTQTNMVTSEEEKKQQALERINANTMRGEELLANLGRAIEELTQESNSKQADAIVEAMAQGIDVFGDHTNEMTNSNTRTMGYVKVWVLALLTALISFTIIVFGMMLSI